jgi:hypothetical protein
VLLVFVFVLQAGIGVECDMRRDPFCPELANAQRLEREWLALDAAVASPQSFREPCVDGATGRIRAARAAAKEKAGAYRRYYGRWVTMAQNTAKAFSLGAVRQADLRRAIDRLLAGAEQDYVNLVNRASTIPENDAGRRPLNDLIRQARQRIANLREAAARWSDDRNSADAAREASAIIRDRMQQAIRSISAESILWDSYYDGIATWNALRCGEIP